MIPGMDDSEFLSKSPYGIGPVLQDIDFIVYGAGAVMSYLDDKGFGPSLVPRNGVHRATSCTNGLELLPRKFTLCLVTPSIIDTDWNSYII